MISRIDRIKRSLVSFGIDQEDVNSVSFELGNCSDKVWQILNKALHINSEKFNIQSEIYVFMSELVNKKHNPASFYELSLQSDLYFLQFAGIPLHAKIISSSKKLCGNCKHLHNKTMSVDEAFRDRPLPHSPCNLDYCKASYCGTKIEGIMYAKPEMKIGFSIETDSSGNIEVVSRANGRITSKEHVYKSTSVNQKPSLFTRIRKLLR